MRWRSPSENQSAALPPQVPWSSLCKRRAPRILIQVRRIHDTHRVVYNPHAVPTAARLTHPNETSPAEASIVTVEKCSSGCKTVCAVESGLWKLPFSSRL